MPIKKFKCSPTIGGSDEYAKLEFVRSLETLPKESEVRKLISFCQFIKDVDLWLHFPGCQLQLPQIHHQPQQPSPFPLTYRLFATHPFRTLNPQTLVWSPSAKRIVLRRSCEVTKWIPVKEGLRINPYFWGGGFSVGGGGWRGVSFVVSYSCFSRRKKTEMIYLLINESRKQSLTDKHLNHKNNHKSKTNQVFLWSLLSGNKKSETFGEKNRYKSGEFELVFFSEAKKMKPQEADACLLDGGVSWTSPEKSAG